MLGSICRPRQDNVCLSSEASRAAGEGFELLCREPEIFQLFAESRFSGVCGLGGSVEETIGRCSLHESGSLCFELTDLRPRDIEEECFDNGGFNLENGTCTSTCQIAILEFRAAVGCCGNSLYNYTDSRFASETSYELWSTCDVTSPGFCDTNRNFIAPSQPLTECQYWDSVCSEEYSRLFFDPDEDCTDSVASLQFCGVDESGEFCQLHPVRVNRDDSLAEAVNESCSMYGPTCPAQCLRALNEFRDALGCCVNNIYFFDEDYNQTVTPELWSLCGVDLPDFCNTTFTAARARQFTSGKDKSDDTIIFVLVAVICVMFLFLVLCLIFIVFLFWRNRRLQK